MVNKLKEDEQAADYCPLRPGMNIVYFASWCKKCEKFEGCEAWKVKRGPKKKLEV